LGFLVKSFLVCKHFDFTLEIFFPCFFLISNDQWFFHEVSIKNSLNQIQQKLERIWKPKKETLQSKFIFSGSKNDGSRNEVVSFLKNLSTYFDDVYI